MNFKNFGVLMILSLAMTGCMVAPVDTDRNHRYDASRSSPDTFYPYAERIGKKTTAFNPCSDGIDDSKSDFVATSDMRDETERGRSSDLRAVVTKDGLCN